MATCTNCLEHHFGKKNTLCGTCKRVAALEAKVQLYDDELTTLRAVRDELEAENAKLRATLRVTFAELRTKNARLRKRR